MVGNIYFQGVFELILFFCFLSFNLLSPILGRGGEPVARFHQCHVTPVCVSISSRGQSKYKKETRTPNAYIHTFFLIESGYLCVPLWKVVISFFHLDFFLQVSMTPRVTPPPYYILRLWRFFSFSCCLAQDVWSWHLRTVSDKCQAPPSKLTFLFIIIKIRKCYIYSFKKNGSDLVFFGEKIKQKRLNFLRLQFESTDFDINSTSLSFFPLLVSSRFSFSVLCIVKLYTIQHT